MGGGVGGRGSRRSCEREGVEVHEPKSKRIYLKQNARIRRTQINDLNVSE